MKTSTMVWTIIVVLVVLGLGWYFWSQNSSMVPVTTDTATVPSGQTQVNTNPNGADYQPGQTDTSSTSVSTSASVGASAGSAPMTATVIYDGKTFTPSSVTIAKGGTVTFKDTAGNMSVASDPHPVHSDYDGTTRSQHCATGYAGAAPFDQCQGSSTFTFTFNKTGSWGYHDHLNETAGGTVVVK